jgi:hypothetical protein
MSMLRVYKDLIKIEDTRSSKGPINDQRYSKAIRDTKSNMLMSRYEGRNVTK